MAGVGSTCSKEAQLLILAGGYPFLGVTPCHSESKMPCFNHRSGIFTQVHTAPSNLTRISQQGFNLQLPSPLRDIKGFQGLLINTRLAQLLLHIDIGCELQRRPWGTIYLPASRLVAAHQLRTSSKSLNLSFFSHCCQDTLFVVRSVSFF